MAFVLDICRL